MLAFLVSERFKGSNLVKGFLRGLRFFRFFPQVILSQGVFGFQCVLWSVYEFSRFSMLDCCSFPSCMGLRNCSGHGVLQNCLLGLFVRFVWMSW